MHIISQKKIKDFYRKHPETEQPLKSWYSVAKKAEWKTLHEVQAIYNTASILKQGRVVFDICGGSYRMVTWINCKGKRIYIRFIGTHKAYDKIDAQTI